MTTLGGSLANRLGYEHLDTDDFYWERTDTPYQQARAQDERLALLRGAIERSARGWVLSGSLDDWSGPLVGLFELVIFVRTPTEVRLARLAKRERQRYGDAIVAGGGMHDHHLDFMEYAAAYDSGMFRGTLRGRHLSRHEAWLSRLTCPVLRLDGFRPSADLVDEVVSLLAQAAHPDPRLIPDP